MAVLQFEKFVTKLSQKRDITNNSQNIFRFAVSSGCQQIPRLLGNIGRIT